MKTRLLLALLIFTTLCLSYSAKGQDRKTEKKLKTLDKYYANGQKDWKVPGMAVAIVKDGQIIFEKGYGVREINRRGLVDENTLFAIASNTKSFTSASLSKLVSEGKINWDDPVQKHIPWFKLYDPYVSANITIRDLLSHRSGLKTFSGDLVWYGSTYSRNEIIERAKYLKPKYGFRSHFGYSNILYLTAGQIIPAVTNITWDKYVKENIFTPLHMDRSITSTNDLKGMHNIALPHNIVKDSVFAIPYLNWDNIAPAGAIISSVHDLSAWLIMHLNKGVYQGKKVLDAAQIHEMQSPNTPIYVSDYSKNFFPTLHFKSYALGWQTFDYAGKKIVTHNGGYDGMISQTVLIPELNTGFVILTNASSGLYYAMLYQTLDVLLHQPEKDWSKTLLARKAKHQVEDAKAISLPTSLDYSEFEGLYGGELYGDASVKLNEAGNLELALIPTPMFKGELVHDNLNTFTIAFPEVPSLPEGKVNFLIDEKGAIYEMTIDIPNPDFDFKELKFTKKNK